MSYKIVITSEFAREAKRISKKYPGLKSDLAVLIAQLAGNPQIGTSIGHDFYKIRLSVSGTGKGKSGGARVITYVVIDSQTVLLAEIYLKTEYTTVDIAVLIQRLKNDGLM